MNTDTIQRLISYKLKDLEELIREDKKLDFQKYSDIVRRSKQTYYLHGV